MISNHALWYSARSENVGSHKNLVQLSSSVVSNPLRPHGLQHARLPCPPPTPGACSSTCPLSRWSHPTISSSVVPFSSCLQSLPVLGSFAVNHFFTSGGQSIGASASASVLPKNIDNGGGYVCWGRGDIWWVSVPYGQFSCEPETTLKHNVNKLQKSNVSMVGINNYE